MLAVTAIDFLNHAFPPIATGKIEIDIGPAFAPFTEESLENQVIAYGINRCDAEAITNRAVGRAAAALHHNVMLATEIDDVPNDQEISGESELLNKRQFLLQLTLHRATDRGISLLRAKPRDRP